MSQAAKESLNIRLSKKKGKKKVRQLAAHWLYLKLEERQGKDLAFFPSQNMKHEKESGLKELGKQACWVLTNV